MLAETALTRPCGYVLLERRCRRCANNLDFPAFARSPAGCELLRSRAREHADRIRLGIGKSGSASWTRAPCATQFIYDRQTLAILMSFNRELQRPRILRPQIERHLPVSVRIRNPRSRSTCSRRRGRRRLSFRTRRHHDDTASASYSRYTHVLPREITEQGHDDEANLNAIRPPTETVSAGTSCAIRSTRQLDPWYRACPVTSSRETVVPGRAGAEGACRSK